MNNSKIFSREKFNNLLVYYQKRQFSKAEKLAKSIIQEFPENHFGWKVLGAALKQLGRIEESLIAMQKSVLLEPLDHEAHNNLGVTLKELDRFDEAFYSYIQAINLKPDFEDAYVNLGIIMKNIRFKSFDPKLYQPLIQLLRIGNLSSPSDLAFCILSLLKHDPLIMDLLLKKNFPINLSEVYTILTKLNKIKLLHQLMRTSPIPDLQFEELFVTIRSLLLKNESKIEATSEVIYFLSTLALHCFTNEYIYDEEDEETRLLKNLETEIIKTLSNHEQPEAKKILCLASYRKLDQYNWCQKLTSLDHLNEVKKRLIEDPMVERKIIQEMPVLEEISDNISIKVKNQYEENPYPRWVRKKIFKPKSILDILTAIKLNFHSESVLNVNAPDILIAGCGTGQQSIETACRFFGCQVLAVDLSFASLAYAKRKTDEFKINNIRYLQADILNLNKLDKKFDIIECVGVLHHMDDPIAGLRVLINLLKPYGLIKIGLYSELARQHVSEARKEIEISKVGTSIVEMREFRQLIIKSLKEKYQQLTKSIDFYSLSMFRDFIFHIKEHQFTIPQIKNCLNNLGLKFCGFENEPAVLNFIKFYGRKKDIYDLAAWDHFEKNNPQTFIGMYQFWCQKR